MSFRCGFGYDAGTAAGLVAGALTESATIGTAMDAISHLDATEAERTAMTNNVPVAFAVTYLVGVTAATWVLSQLGPKLLRVDLAAECRKLEDEMLGSEPPPLHARREIELRAYAVERGGRWVGRRVAALELAAPGERLFVERIRSRGRIFPGDKRLTLRAGDVVAISARRTTLVETLEQSGSGLRETDDKELLDLPGELLDVVVTNAAIDGRTLADLAQEEQARGVFLKRITRAGQPLGPLPGLRVYRGDVLTIGGVAANVARAVRYLGVADRATDVTDMFVVATAIVAGALIGVPALQVGNVEIGLSLPVGVLLGGLVCGWLRSMRATFVRPNSRANAVGVRIDRAHGFRRRRRPERRPRFRAGRADQRAEPRRGRRHHRDGRAARRRAGGPLALQAASRRAARRRRGRVHRDAGACGHSRSRQERRAVDRLWRGVCRR